MTMQSKLVLVGVEHIDGAKSSYAMCAFAQGADVCKLMCKDTAVEKLPLYKHYDVTLQYNSKYDTLQVLKMVGIQ